MEYAQTLGVRRLNCLAGVRPADTSFNQARETVVANLAFAAQVLRNAGIELLIEPVNTIDVPGFFRETLLTGGLGISSVGVIKSYILDRVNARPRTQLS